MAVGVPLLDFYPQFLDDDGKPVANGSVALFLAGTDTPTPAYFDLALTISLGVQPGLDVSGRLAAYLDPALAYKVTVKRSNGTVVRTRDNLRFAAPTAAQAIPEWMLILGW